MGRIVVRKQKETKNPYVIPGLNRRIYSLEELVYVYFQNLSFLDETIIDIELCDWLEKEMNFTGLAGKLKLLVLQDCGMEPFLNLIFSSIPYYREEELDEIQKVLSDWLDQIPLERKKAHMDHLLDQGNGREAMAGYLKLEREGKEEPEILGKIYHNMGVIYAKRFDFHKAAEYFQKACQLTENKESKEMYMLSLRMSLSKADYVERIGREGLLEEQAVLLEEKILALLSQEAESRYRLMFEQLIRNRENGNQGLYQEGLNQLLREFKETWRNC